MRFLFLRVVCLSIIFGGSGGFVSADPWHCGTPLLYQEHLHQHSVEVPAAPAAPVQIGHVERFFVHIPEAEVTATCIAKSEHLYVYVDNAVRDLFTDAEAAEIAAEFDRRIYPEVRKWMGTEWKPGLDRDNRITLLMHDVGMNNSGADYGGYFAPADQLPTLPNSNRREMIYMDVFQFRERSRHTFYSSLAHEFAHLINWFQNGGTTDQRWLEEGTASFVEWAVYGTVHNIFVDGYLATPDVSLTYANTADIYYGASFMLMLYLYEHYGGNALIREIIETDALGEHAITAALEESGRRAAFHEVFLNWGLANWANTQREIRRLGYTSLPNRRVTAPVPRRRSYPSRSNNISIDAWGVRYILFENLPETLEISVIGEGTGNLYATTLYQPFSGRSVVTSVPFDLENRGSLHFEGLAPTDEIVLAVTAAAPQTFRYSAAVPDNVNDVAAIVPRPNPPEPAPDVVTHAIGSLTQPSPVPTNWTIGMQLKPMTQVHMGSNYIDVALGAPDAPYLYAASEWGLEIFTLADPTQPARIGEIGTPGTAESVVVEGGTAYVADGTAGIQVIDVALPTRPSLIKTVGGFTNVHKVDIADDKLYALDSERGMLVFNLQDIRNMLVPLPRRFFRTAGEPINVGIHNDVVYFSDNRHGLFILDPSPFGDFVVRGVLPILATAYQIAETGGATHVYVASGNLVIADVTDDENPEVDVRLNTPGIATGIHAHDGIVYLSDNQTGLHIINVDNPQQPRRLSVQPTVGNATDVVLRGTLAYVADGKGGIQTVDVSEPVAPKWLHRYASDGTAYGVAVVEAGPDARTLYVANGTGGLKTLEFTTPYDGSVTERLLLPPQVEASGFQAANCTKIRVHNGYGFVAVETGMFVVDLAGGRVVAHIPTPSPVSDIALYEGYAYLCAESLIVVDSRVPHQSRIVSTRHVPGTAYRLAVDAVAPAYAYVAALEGGLHVFDMMHPANPRHISSYATQGNATGVAFAAERVYLLESGKGVVVLDVAEPNAPNLRAIYESDRLPIDAEVSGDSLYLLDTESVHVVDTRTLTATSHFRGLRFPFELEVLGSTLYVADLDQLRIFRIYPEGYSLAVEEGTPSEWTPTPLKPRFVDQLSQNFPNPFNPDTWIPYQLASDVDVTLRIYDAQGRRIYFRELGYRKAGSHTAYWDGRNAAGEPVASGIYFYTLQAGDFQATRKMIIQR